MSEANKSFRKSVSKTKIKNLLMAEQENVTDYLRKKIVAQGGDCNRETLKK